MEAGCFPVIQFEPHLPVPGLKGRFTQTTNSTMSPTARPEEILSKIWENEAERRDLKGQQRKQRKGDHLGRNFMVSNVWLHTTKKMICPEATVALMLRCPG